MFTHEVQIRVCYADTDQMGYVYYGNYAWFYEIGRVEALRSIGFNYRELEASGIMMPVYENTSRYLQPARYDDLLTVRVMLKTLPSVRMVFEYEIYNQTSTLLHTGITTLVFLNRDTNKPCRAPRELLERLQPFLA